MSIFTYHLVKTSYISALKAILLSLKPINTPGLIHAECTTVMTLGSAVFSPSRMLVRQVAVFAQWENEAAIDHFLNKNSLGKIVAKGWHVRLTFLRQWGAISEFEIPDELLESDAPDAPVVAVTLARMKLPEIPRFIRWGRPVEKLVRDHPGTILSLASIRLPRTISTFSIWKSQKEMTDMVRGHSAVPQPERHADAMKERERKDFHFEFTTLRFKPISEFGEWNGRTNFIPDSK
ncbi:hypothetical protein F0919_07545 [Taibaiella lutea]|uniref:Spheroidene monooxygenase n=1 Tax=Taibaiella lutea TaxID=2608001 RepID=A0A5M6CGW4_9BACT|nr:hypothetical protein [Taibaiella lutea]KAA5534468.1 hypothetical protein F0919_07545 [Taibaiella lutea]